MENTQTVSNGFYNIILALVLGIFLFVVLTGVKEYFKDRKRKKLVLQLKKGDSVWTSDNKPAKVIAKYDDHIDIKFDDGKKASYTPDSIYLEKRTDTKK